MTLRRGAVAGVACALLLVAATPGCSRCPEPADKAGGASASDLSAISRLHDDYTAAHNSADPDRLVGLFTDDGVLMPMDEPAVSGKQAIRDYYEDFFDQNPSTIELQPVETRAACDWAYERIQVKVTLSGGVGGKHVDIKSLWILQKQPDGSWKIARAIDNLDGSIDDDTGQNAGLRGANRPRAAAGG